MIRKATKNDLDWIEASYTELLTREAEQGSNTNWQLGLYPTRETAQRSLDEETLYVLQEEDGLCASMTLNQVQPAVYNEISWAFPAAPEDILLIHTLCLPPSKAGRGFGKAMTSYAAAKAKEMECKVIRLDTYAGNEPAATLYRSLGYHYAGKAETLHEGVIPEELIFFEKKI